MTVPVPRRWVHDTALAVVAAVMGALIGNAIAFRSANSRIDEAKTALSMEITSLQRRVDVLQAEQASQARNAERDRVEILSAIEKLSDRVFTDSARRYMRGDGAGAGAGSGG